jgi:hypothetical protein
MKLSTIFGGVAITLSLSTTAFGQETDDAAPSQASASKTQAAAETSSALEPEAHGPKPAARRYEAPLVLDAGGRVGFLRSEGYDPFSQNDAFGQLSIGGAVEIWRSGRFAIAPGGRWEFGQRNGEARGAKTNFSMHRLAASLEGRVYATPWLYAFGRLAPGVAYQRARVAEPSAPADLTASDWLPSVDASLGATAMSRGPFRIGGTVDFGYGFVSDLKMSLRPDLPPEDPRRTAAVNLRDVNASGPFFRLGVVVVF